MIRKRRTSTDPPELSSLVEATRQLPGFSMVGFAARSDPPEAEVGSLPFDQRSPAAGLFGLRASRSWYAVGVTLEGVARMLEPADAIGDVSTGLVVTRDGQIGSFISRAGAGEDVAEDEIVGTDGVHPDGLVVDAMHRMLGLPSPGDPPDPSEMVMSLWLDDILTVLAVERRIDWAQMVRIHPVVHGQTAEETLIPPSDEMLVEATARSREYVDWGRVHRRASRSEASTAGLTPEEVRWMDPTMFARWSLSLLPGVPAVVRALSDLGCHYEADRLSSLSERLTFVDPPISGAA